MMRCRGQLTKGGIGAFIYFYSLYEGGLWLMGECVGVNVLVRFFVCGF